MEKSKSQSRSAGRKIDTSFLESLVGYNCRRAALTVIEHYLERMAIYGIRPVEFSVLSLALHNPGITSRELCHTLGILSPNLVRIVASLDTRGLIAREPHPTDGRAIGIYLQPKGVKVVTDAEKIVRELEDKAAKKLSTSERTTLMTLLQKIYKS